MAAKAVIVATGSGPVMPPIPGLSSRSRGNREATTAKVAAERLVILGGGVVVELAQAWVSLARKSSAGGRSARDRSRGAVRLREVEAALREAGVDVRIDLPLVSVARDGDVTVMGRRLHRHRPNCSSLWAGSQHDSSPRHRTEPGKRSALESPFVAHDWLYAIGDANGRALLTHTASTGRLAAPDPRAERDAGSDGPLAAVIFTDPQVAGVGHTLDRQRRPMVVRAVDVETGSTAGASYVAAAPGTSRLVIDDVRHVIVGATFTGVEVSRVAARGDDRRRLRSPSTG